MSWRWGPSSALIMAGSEKRIILTNSRQVCVLDFTSIPSCDPFVWSSNNKVSFCRWGKGGMEWLKNLAEQGCEPHTSGWQSDIQQHIPFLWYADTFLLTPHPIYFLSSSGSSVRKSRIPALTPPSHVPTFFLQKASCLREKSGGVETWKNSSKSHNHANSDCLAPRPCF